MYAPIDNVYSELRCHCITFYSASETAPCALTDSQYLDWEDAQTLASAYDLRIKFASSSTVSKVLEVEQPLPTGVLKSMTRVDDRSSTGRMMVCGFGDEVNQKYMSGSDGSLEVNGYDLFASKVVAVLLLIIILYAAGEFVWMKLFAKGGRIKLTGQEKDLTAYLAGQKSRTSPAPESHYATEASLSTEYP